MRVPGAEEPTCLTPPSQGLPSPLPLSLSLPQLLGLPGFHAPFFFFPTILGSHSQDSLETLPPPRHSLVGRGQPTKAAQPSLGQQAGPAPAARIPGVSSEARFLISQPLSYPQGRELGHRLLLDGTPPPAAAKTSLTHCSHPNITGHLPYLTPAHS